ncbi:hypothetical protein F0562_027632 [Nyssa sinensis]|uniref:C2 domain-containing protein n=1 Tax=Nyssa sinensis TaxID=561372 RepID=A0A5J5B577_9ASTE|nr:hypothetical protein F0562_027632 [Nyssa sinensis]
MVGAPMPIPGIQGQPLEVTVVGCTNLDDKEWISRQDPYVCLDYGSSKVRTKTCTDGGRNPTFQEKFIFTLIEGLQELNVVIWNSHTLSADEFICTGRIPLHKALSQGYDDSAWPLYSKSGRFAGEVRLILHYSKTIAISQSTTTTRYAPPAGPYATPNGTLSTVLPYNGSQPAPAAPYPAATTYPGTFPYMTCPPNSMTPSPSPSPSPCKAYPPNSATASPYVAYPPYSATPPPFATYPPTTPTPSPWTAYPPNSAMPSPSTT